MQLECRKLLEDIRYAGDLIVEFVAGKSLDDYRADVMLQSAVERQFQIVGEALNRLSKGDPDIAAQIRYTSRIIAFRNILTHGYDVVDHAVVWDIVKEHLPSLQLDVQQLIERQD
jgi:uncharacterized protein with HEPN domain